MISQLGKAEGMPADIVTTWYLMTLFKKYVHLHVPKDNLYL